MAAAMASLWDSLFTGFKSTSDAVSNLVLVLFENVFANL